MLKAEEKSEKTLTDCELELTKLFVPNIPKDIIFPEELNSYLRDQIQYLTYENSRLEKNLSDKELKLKESLIQAESLSKQVQNYENAVSQSTFSSVSNVASSKIVELSKKLREKSAELQVLKTKCSKLEQQVFSLQQKEQSEQTETVPEKEKPTNELEEQIKQLQDKLNITSAKLFESKNTNVKLKNELKLANKFVQQEIGDTVQNIASSGSSWRGRAQVICDLQQKNIELKEKLKLYQNGKPPTETISQTKPDRRLELLSRENTVLKTDLHEVKRRLEGARARSKLIESECSVLRAKVTALTEQQDNDRNLVATLSSQLSHTKVTQQEYGKQKDQSIHQLERDYKTLHLELIKERCRYENLQKDVKDKDLEIEELKNGKASESSTNLVDQRALNRLEAERIKLLELTEIANKRVEDERAGHVNIQLQLRTERQKTAKLEAKISRLQLEYLDKTSAYSLPPNSKAKENNNMVEDRLVLAEETIKVLQNRLEMEQRERQMDFEEFAHILKNYKPIETEVVKPRPVNPNKKGAEKIPKKKTNKRRSISQNISYGNKEKNKTKKSRKN